MLPTDPFEFSYEGSEILFGRGRANRLGELLDARGLERALVVTGTNVGANRDVMGPIESGLDDRLVGVFAETTPAKQGATVSDGVTVMEDLEADVIIGVGGGSSLDIARQISVFAAADRSIAGVREQARDQGEVSPPSPDHPAPVIVVPTTFAGADISSGGSVTVLPAEEAPGSYPVRTSGSNTPIAMVYDPELFETTPMSALAGSAMNGFNKGIETPYARDRSPITNATAIHGLRYLREGLVGLEKGTGDIERTIVGLILVQFERRLSIIHAFGHGFSQRYDVQQGDVHAIVAPTVLRYLFENVDGNRRLLADGLDIETTGMNDGEVANAVVQAVRTVRDALDRPTRLRDLEGPHQEHLPEIAEFVLRDPVMKHAPAGLDLTVAEIEELLHEIW